MPSSPTAPPGSDFIGFLDGIQARNLAAIERDVELPLADMQTRVSMLQCQVRSETVAPAEVARAFSELEAILHRHAGTVVDRLVESGDCMAKLLIQAAPFLRSSDVYLGQIKGFVRAFITAAENSQNDRIIKTAEGLANAFTEVRAA